MNATPKPFYAYSPPYRCRFDDCAERLPYREMAICREHAAQAWKLFEDVEPETYKRIIRGEGSQVAAEKRAAKAEAKQRKRFNNLRPGSIYYLAVGDRVKIGFTTDLYQRMMQYPPFSELLALHPGTPKLEKEMHAKFTRYLADGREWFHPNEELTNHLAEVNEKFPLNTSIAKIRERLVAPAASTLRPRSSSMVRKV